MPLIPGLFATPTVLANALLSLAQDASLPVIGPDRVGIVSPMFNEEAGAEAALASLLRQTSPFDELVVSINGGTDDTAAVVRRTLSGHGYRAVDKGAVPDTAATYERWLLHGGGAVAVVEHAEPISKSDSINVALTSGLLNSERVVIVDGDTVFDEGFLAALKTNFYRLRRVGRGPGARYHLEDFAIQSGTVMSARPSRGSPVAGLVHRARSAEYAIASLLRAGQTARLGSGGVFGRSRLYTVVGCGFAARRDYFPMPSDTLTEDHDFTLTVQNGPVTEEVLTAEEAASRGFKVVMPGGEVGLAEVVGDRPVTLRRSSDARFVTEALMYTEDPPTLHGYLRQIERWNGGGVENGLKRFFIRENWRGLRANVRFTELAAHFENLFGLLLVLVLLPLFVGREYALPGRTAPLLGPVTWLAIDLVATVVLAGWGFSRIWRRQGVSGWRLAGRVFVQTGRSVLALTLLRPFNVLTFVTGAWRASRRFVNRHEIDPRVTITWDRPGAASGRRTPLRYLGVSSMLLVAVSSLFLISAWVAADARPGYKDTWRLIYASVPVDQRHHQQVHLPLGGSSVLDVAPVVEATVVVPPGGAADPVSSGAGDVHEAVAAVTDAPPTATAPDASENVNVKVMAAMPAGRGVSAFCSVTDVRRPAAERRRLEAPLEDYAPLSSWGLLVLARLAPLAATIEEAATAYDVPPDFLLRVLINESYLDPLAVGPTGDLGLSQVTSDALTLIRALSSDDLSPYANPAMFAGSFSVFDPDFSVCAGAVKLAWARSQPGGADDHLAYARYINPLEGVVRGRVSEQHAELVLAIDKLEPLTHALAATLSAYRADPGLVTEEERALLGVTDLVADGELTVAQAYFITAGLVETLGIDDRSLYDAIRDTLYGDGGEAKAPATVDHG